MDTKNNKLKEALINFLTVAGDLIALNFLWLVCSIPLITIGPATCALYDVTLKLAEDPESSVLKRFFKAFKENFTQALFVGVFSIFAIITIYVDIIYALNFPGTIQKIYIVVAIALSAILLILISYGYALIVRYKNTLKEHIKNAFKLAFVNPVQTIMIWIILLFPLLMFLFIQPIILVYLGWLLIFFFSLPNYLCAKIIYKVFKKIENKEGKDA